jgi:hypothetical protein
MSASPVFASVGHNGLGQLNNASSTTISSAFITGVAAGTRIREIRVYSGPTTAPGTGVLTLQISDGTTTNCFEVLTLTNTVNAQMGVFTYSNLILPGTGWTIKSQMQTAITSGGTIYISILGEDLT